MILDGIFNVLTDFCVVILIAGIVLCWRLPRRSKFFLRLLVCLPYWFVFSPLCWQISPVGNLMSWLWTLPYINAYYLAGLAAVTLILWFCFRASFLRILFFSLSGYLVEHFCSHAMQLFTYAIQGHHVTIPTISRVFEFFLLIAVLCLMYFLLLRRMYNDGISLDNRFMLFFIVVAVLAISVFSATVFYIGMVSPVTHVYEMIVSFLLVIIKFEAFGRTRAQQEKRTIEQVLEEQGKQQAMFNENIEFIRMKSHDLKHQICLLKEQGGLTGKEESLKELETAVMIEETQIHTGNEVLDVLLTEKQLTCQRKNIQFVCLADGAALNFLSSTDLCSLFGNALSNAIEAVEGYEEEKRQIKVVVKREENLVHIYVENYFEGGLQLKNGLPVTTKSDKAEHGFGMKSLRYIVEKYKGNINVTIEDNFFNLNILFLV